MNLASPSWSWWRWFKVVATFSLAGPAIGLLVVMTTFLLPILAAGDPGDCGSCQSAATVSLLALFVVTVVAVATLPVAMIPAATAGVVAGMLRELRLNRLIYVVLCPAMGAAVSWFFFDILFKVGNFGLATIVGGVAGLLCALLTLRNWPAPAQTIETE